MDQRSTVVDVEAKVKGGRGRPPCIKIELRLRSILELLYSLDTRF